MLSDPVLATIDAELEQLAASTAEVRATLASLEARAERLRAARSTIAGGSDQTPHSVQAPAVTESLSSEEASVDETTSDADPAWMGRSPLRHEWWTWMQRRPAWSAIEFLARFPGDESGRRKWLRDLVEAGQLCRHSDHWPERFHLSTKTCAEALAAIEDRNDGIPEYMARTINRRDWWRWMEARESFRIAEFNEAFGFARPTNFNNIRPELLKRRLLCEHEHGSAGNGHTKKSFHVTSRPCTSERRVTSGARETVVRIDEKEEDEGEAPSAIDVGDRLTVENDRLAWWLARKFQWSGEPLEDLVQEARMGLMHAARRFDPSKGNKFSTYAVTCAHASVLRYLNRRAPTVRTPQGIAAPRAISIDVEDDEGATIFQEAAGEASAHEIAVDGERSALLRAAMTSLDTRSRRLLEMRFGILRPGETRWIGKRGGSTLGEIADALGVSRSRVRQIEQKALLCLRSKLEALAP